MAQVDFDPIIKWFRGKIGKLVYRRAHNGKISVFPKPDMSHIEWSLAQKEHQGDFGEASRYASAAVADPEIRAIYVQMAIEQNKNPKRPSDIASKDYYHTGNDLLWKKHMGIQEKPENWDMNDYSWYLNRTAKRRGKKPRSRRV
jgi:hypothetical protein